MAEAWNGPMPFEAIRWNMAERFGWTLEYIDGLSLKDLGNFIRIQDGQAKARQPGMKPGA